MKNLLKSRNWGLKLLALALAIIIYYSLKTETAHPTTNDTSFFHYR